jgi:HlyD family secretion protein
MSNFLANRRSELALAHGGLPAQADEPALDDVGGEVRLGVIVAGLFFVLFLGWAAFAPLDSAAYATGQLVVSGQRQSVQHRDGGVVSAIHVAEGRQVRKGDTLIELAGAEVRAQERALAAQMVNLQAQRARLEAELAGASLITWPAEFTTATGSRRAAIDEAIRVQSNEFRARRSLLAAQSQVLGQQTAQANQSATGYRSKMISSAEQERLIQAEIDALRPIAERSSAPRPNLRASAASSRQVLPKRGHRREAAACAKLKRQPPIASVPRQSCAKLNFRWAS